MIRIGFEDFRELRRRVSSVRRLNVPGYPRGMLFTILSQKKVDYVKRDYPKAVEKLDEIARCWKREEKLPEWLRLTPVMRVRLLLKAVGISKAEVNRILNDPSRIQLEEAYHPEKLERLIWKALYTDYIYSPLAARHQRARGKLGEEIIRKWLEMKNIDFSTENDLKKRFPKTPDFFFEEPVKLNGKHVRWVESKALFGDPRTHRIYSRKQFEVYREMFGDGYVVYWFGCVKEVENALETEFFNSPVVSSLKAALNDMIVYTTGDREKAKTLAERLKAHVVDLEDVGIENATKVELCENVNDKEFLEGVGKIIDCYSHGRILIVDSEKNWKNSVRKDVGWILSNMGFVVVHV